MTFKLKRARNVLLQSSWVALRAGDETCEDNDTSYGGKRAGEAHEAIASRCLQSIKNNQTI